MRGTKANKNVLVVSMAKVVDMSNCLYIILLNVKQEYSKHCLQKCKTKTTCLKQITGDMFGFADEKEPNRRSVPGSDLPFGLKVGFQTKTVLVLKKF